MKKKNKVKLFKRYDMLTFIVVLFIIAFLSLGYSHLITDMNLGTKAVLRIQKDIRVSGLIATNQTSSGMVNWSEYNVSSLFSNINLPNSNSTVTYNFKVTNLGNVEACISAITGLDSNLQYTLNNYTLNNMLCDDLNNNQCTLGSTTTISITIGYAPNSYDINNTSYSIGMDLEFAYMTDAVAKIGNSYYNTLQAAVNAVPTDHTETTILLLKNTSENVSIASTKTINLNLNGRTLSNTGNLNVISNNGVLHIYGGTVFSDASTQGAINNESTGTFEISSGRVIMTGGRQALYNNKGTATISGSAYLSSSATERAAVQNVTPGTLYITGGTIVSTGSYAINNAGSLRIGVKDGTVNINTPILQALDNSIYSTTTYKIYDGIYKSKTDPFNDISQIIDRETGYGFISSTEVIDNETYNTSYLGVTKTITIKPNGGTVSPTVKYVLAGQEIGSLPTPVRSTYEFVGWYTLASGGNLVDEHYIVTNDMDIFAHWQKIPDIARIGTTYYDSLQDAINAAPANTLTTIELLKDTMESLTVSSSKKIIFDFAGRTLSNNGNSAVIVSEGEITITNGTLQSNADTAAIDANDGKLTITGGQIIATGTRQAIYIRNATVEVSGTAYFSSQTSGKPNGSSMERGTIQNIAGTLIITGGTIVGEKQQAISNEGTLTIGSKDGSITVSTPELVGKIYGVKSTGTFNFYDGIIKGQTNSINGTVTDKETNSQIINGTETIGGATYQTAYLGIVP